MRLSVVVLKTIDESDRRRRYLFAPGRTMALLVAELDV